jgi:hypothetical protein
MVVGVGVCSNEEDVDDMEDKEGPDGDPGEAVKGPGEHPLAPAIGDRSAESATWSREG